MRKTTLVGGLRYLEPPKKPPPFDAKPRFTTADLLLGMVMVAFTAARCIPGLSIKTLGEGAADVVACGMFVVSAYLIFTLIRRRFGPDRQWPLVFAVFLIAAVAGLIASSGHSRDAHAYRRITANQPARVRTGRCFF